MTDNRTNEMIVSEVLRNATGVDGSTCEQYAAGVVLELSAAGRLAGEPTETQVKLAYLAHLKAPRTRGMDVYGPMRAALVAAQAAAPAVTGSTSDGYHTFDELYEYRMLYNAHAAHGWLAAGIPVVKSWRHSDGEECFGGGWFIVTATLPSGQVSNHYKAEHWGLFKVPEVDLPPEYDGHTPHDAARRLRIEAEHAAPVLPSSTCQHNMVSYTDSVAKKREHFCSLCGYEPSSTVDVAKIESLIIGRTATAGARAVAEWLKGQGGESRGE